MEFTIREKIRKNWNGKECEHPHIEKVFYYNSDTGYYACTQCGLLMLAKDLAEAPACPDAPLKSPQKEPVMD